MAAPAPERAPAIATQALGKRHGRPPDPLIQHEFVAMVLAHVALLIGTALMRIAAAAVAFERRDVGR